MGILARDKWLMTGFFGWLGTRNNRGQLQIQETILVIFIFIVLIMLGLVFFYRVQISSIKSEFNEFEREKLSVDFITLGELPEFSCSKLGEKESCVDTGKLIVFMGLNGSSKYREYYFSRFGYKNITFYQIYPKPENSEQCNPSRLSDCSVWNIYYNKPANFKGRKVVLDTPVSLYYPKNGDKYDVYTIGRLVVEAYDAN